MDEREEKRKTYLTVTSCVMLSVVLSVFLVLMAILIIIIFRPTQRERILIFASFGVMLLFILTIFLCEGTGTVKFMDNRIVVKRWLFSRRRYLLYSDIDYISIFYGYIPMGYRRAGGQQISIFRKKGKNAVINIEITYPIVIELLKHTQGIRIRVDYSSLMKFSKKHRELLWGYLRESQKEEILKRLNKRKNRRNRDK